eukprot:TRINITY_DN3753_c0_g1_i5.p1 TRINITY_DN3753_c0_g1~~TRINITY_DN3753_c0_g1_i5.p1  ORF type:complete len:613 (-),score=61.51 TRINITY_DN3753_c0_g1_i5:127-1965(-)
MLTKPQSGASLTSDGEAITKSACTAIVVVGLAEQMTLVRTQRLVRKGVLTLERASLLFSPAVLSGVEPTWFCGPCGMLVAPTEVRDNDRLNQDQRNRKQVVCPHCRSPRLGKRGSHVWTPTFPSMGRVSRLPAGSLSISPPIITDGTDYTGHNLPESALTSIKLSTSQIQASDWVCKKCSWYNFRDQVKCRRCSGGRAVSALTIVFDGAKLGDWVCGNCMRLNFHKLDTCYGCYPPLKEGRTGEASMATSRSSTGIAGAGMIDVDAGSAFLTRDEMDKVNLSAFKAPEEDTTATSTAEDDAVTTTKLPLVRKPFIGARAHALVILGEDLNDELYNSLLPPPTPGAEVPIVELDRVNALLPRIYSSFGVCPSCSYRHHHLDILPGSRCKECNTELTIKMYPYVEKVPPTTTNPAPPVLPTSVDAPPQSAPSAEVVEEEDGVSTAPADSSLPPWTPTKNTFTAPTPSIAQFIRTKECSTCHTLNHIDRTLCRRCGSLTKGWMCTADDLPDDELFEDGVVAPTNNNDTADSTTTEPPRTCSHLNDDSNVYCTKCGTCRKDAPPARVSPYDRKTFGSRIEGHITQSPNWLSKGSKTIPMQPEEGAGEGSKEESTEL